MPDIETIRVIIPLQKVVKINVGTITGGTFTPGIEPANWFLGGPISGAPALASFRPLEPEDMEFAAILDEDNIFTGVNTTPGLRIGTQLVSADTTLTKLDFEVLVSASGGNRTITLPAAIGDGQIYRVKKIDATDNTVTVAAQAGDLIDGQASVVLSTQYADATVIDADVDVWDRFSNLGGLDPTDVARLSVHNIFTALNTFKSVQFSTRTVTADYSVAALDFEILVNAATGNVTISLPAATGSGRTIHVKRIDATGNTVIIDAAGSDTIDGAANLSLPSQWIGGFLFDAASGYWAQLSTAIDLTDIPKLSLPNVFTQVNTISGIRHKTRTVTSNTALLANDYEVEVDASGGAVIITLPASSANGQVFRIKKIDGSLNPVTVTPQLGDLIDGDSSVVIDVQYAGLTIIDAATGAWDNTFSLPTDVALKSQANIFSDINTFTAIRLSTRTITADYTVDPSDFEILVDASGGDVNVTLPQALGTGMSFRAKKIDSSGNLVTVTAFTGDLIDDSISVSFDEQFASVAVFDAAIGYWDNETPLEGGGGADFGVNGRVRDLYPVRGFAFDVFDGTDWVEQVRYVEPSTGPPVSAQVGYYWRPEIVDLTTLKAFPTVGNDLSTRLDAMYGAASNVAAFSIYTLETGAASGGDPGQVAPDDYNVSTNDVHWKQRL